MLLRRHGPGLWKASLNRPFSPTLAYTYVHPCGLTRIVDTIEIVRDGSTMAVLARQNRPTESLRLSRCGVESKFLLMAGIEWVVGHQMAVLSWENENKKIFEKKIFFFGGGRRNTFITWLKIPFRVSYITNPIKLRPWPSAKKLRNESLGKIAMKYLRIIYKNILNAVFF